MHLREVFCFLLGAIACQSLAAKPFLCYYESWAKDRAAPYGAGLSKVPTDLCTHVIYAFAGLDEATGKVKVLQSSDQQGYKDAVALKKKKPNLKVLLAVGGASEGVAKYSKMVADPKLRKTFIDSVHQLANSNGFDGIDIDWEYPGDTKNGGKAADKKNFVTFLKELRRAFGSKLLTVAVDSTEERIKAGYDVAGIAKYVDYINVMTYDLRSTDDGETGIHVTLYPSKNDKGDFIKWTVSQGMKNWAKHAPKRKLIMGFAFYGTSFTLKDSNNNAVGAKAGVGAAGTDGAKGTMFYPEICSKITKDGWTRKFDDKGKVPYAFKGTQWVGYEDPEGIGYKTKLIKKEGYGGAMCWAILTDDHSNLCKAGAFPLAKAVVKGLK